jgi:DNA-binding LacI/PurR family transcriptional regulator
MVRLKDSALRAGVSLMTVSKVLRDAPDISPATKARIKMLVEEMGYVPDSMAQGLRTRTTHLIGLVVSASTNPIFAPAILAIEEQAHDLGYALLLAHTLNDPEREQTIIRRMLARRVDGMIIAPVYRLAPSAPIYEELFQSKTPVVILGQKTAFCSHFPSVETEDLLGSFAATQHLLQLGHRRVAFFAGSTLSPWSQERLEGYKRAFREASLELDETLIFNAGSTIEDGEKAALQMLNEGVKATAIQAATDLVAVGAASILLKQGFKIPEQISIVGFGNVLLGEHFKIPLTTVRQPKFRLGVAAMESFRKLVRHEPVDSKRLTAELLVRQSTAPVAT